MSVDTDSPLNAAIRQFELAEANLCKLERLWSEIESEIPGGICFVESADVEDRCRSYAHILEHLPAIDGFKPETVPMDLDTIAQRRLDAAEIGEFECKVSTENAIYTPGRELREYRYHFNRARRRLVRDSIEETVKEIDGLLVALKASPDYSADAGANIESEHWETLKTKVDSLVMTLGRDMPTGSRWSDLTRHLRFGQANDLRDIIELDWPDVRKHVYMKMYSEDDPLPVEVSDLGELVKARPTGPIATKLNWSSLDSTDFERLTFALVSNEAGYENPEWLMQTNAPDRGRDISVQRVIVDSLGGTIRHRVIIQCKHWLSKSISVSDISSLRDQMKLWEPPRIDVHVIATSGRFTADAVAFIENHNQSDTALRIEMWAESHLERLLAMRPGMIATFGLR